jgi:glucose/arabinose dehydrogenase
MKKLLIFLSVIFLLLILIFVGLYTFSNDFAGLVQFYVPILFTKVDNVKDDITGPVVLDEGLFVEKFAEGLNLPTSMIIINDEILVAEQKTGKILKISSNGVMQEEPVLEISVATKGLESGLLGLVNFEDDVYVYHTVQKNEENQRNIITKYDYDGNLLINPVKIQELSGNSQGHNGGTMTISHNNEIFVSVGDAFTVNKYSNFDIDTPHKSVKLPDQHVMYQSDERNISSSILKITNGEVEHFAMGIRNSFGLAVDPVTGFLWETENGPHIYDEINLIKEKFNGGWVVLAGPTTREDGYNTFENIELKINFPGYEYGEPKFSWQRPIGITAIAFPELTNQRYSDYLFVGDIANGIVYKFKLNENRNGFVFNNEQLKDLVFDRLESNNEIKFVTGIPGGITDILFHNNTMYIISFVDGSIFKISFDK